MPIIAVTGRKGGIGKSTITANLAVELLALGHSVAVIDTDPQKSLKHWAALGEGVLSDIVVTLDTESPDLFRGAVAAAQERVDIVLIDTPPGFADPALMANLVADLVLLPVGPSPLDIMAVNDAVEVARQVRQERKTGKPEIRFIPSRTVANVRLSNDLPASLEEIGEPVLPGIGLRTVIAEAALSGHTVREYAPASKAGAEFEALAIAVEGALK